MRRLRILARRLRALFRKGPLDAALDEELRFHLEMETERHIGNGMSPEEARIAARRSFGGVEQVKEIYRDRRGLPGVETLARDLAQAVRTLRRHPGYTIVAVLSLALGIGANTAVFSLLDAFVLRPLPYPEPDRLVLIYEAGMVGGRYSWGSVAAPVLRDWRERSRAFTAIGAFAPGSVNLRSSDGAVRVPATFAEPEVFQALGVPPLHGRLLLPENSTPGLDHVVVLSHALWKDRFGGNKDVIGQTVRIDASDYTIVGVMPASFEFPPRASAALWVPLLTSSVDFVDRGLKRLSVIARVKPDVSVGAARQDMANVSRQLEAIYPNSRVAWLRPLHGDTVGRTALVLIVLAGTVGFVLLLACANVAHMVLARANARRHEFAVRLALGASRWRIMRLLLAEGFLLAMAGGLVGVAACRWALDALLSLPANPLPAGVPVSISGSVLGYCALASVLTALGVSLIPAFRMSRQKLQADLAEAVPSSRQRARHGNLLITIEVALSMVLVIGAGMLVRSLRALTDLDFGFRPENILTVRMSMPPGRYPDVTRLHSFYDRLLERLSGVPGVEAVGLNNLLPIQMTYTNMDFTVEGRPNDRPGYEPFAEHRTVNADFFRAMGIPVVSGRSFTRAENRPGSGVVVISKRAATLYWPNVDPVGKRLAYGTRPKPDRWLTIVGVAGDIKSAGLGQPPQAILYAPYRDFDFPIQSVSLIVRTTATPASSARAVREAVRELDPDLALYWVSTMEDVIAQSTAGTRFLAVLLAAFSGLAVLLAMIGVYGVMSYVVGQRHREIGLRMALGASRREVLQFVLGHGTRRTLVGIGIGILWAIMLSQAMRPFLIGIGPVDVASQAGAAAVILAVALAASALPAYRASRVDPIEALRHE
jgi:putative ABC transport system permease protein